jgi:hypothetical protein
LARIVQIREHVEELDVELRIVGEGVEKHAVDAADDETAVEVEAFGQ